VFLLTKNVGGGDGDGSGLISIHSHKPGMYSMDSINASKLYDQGDDFNSSNLTN